MKTTPLPDQDGLDEIIDGLYAASAGERSFDSALKALSEPLRAHITLMGVRKNDGQDFPVVDTIHANVGERAWNAFLNHYRFLEPALHVIPRQPPGSVVSLDALGMRQLVKGSEFYNDFGRLHGADESLYLWSPLGDGFGVGFAVHREERCGVFEADEVAYLERLASHLVRATRVWLSGPARGSRWSLEALDTLESGIVRVRADGEVVWVNRAASTMLKRADGLRLDGKRLVAVYAEDADALRRVIAAPRDRGSDPLAIRTGGPGGYEVTAVPSSQESGDRDEVTLMVRIRGEVPETTRTWLQTQFGLTGSEARVVELLARGLSVVEISEKLRAARGTTRNHLKRAMAKTGTRRQVDLVRLVLLRWDRSSRADRGRG